MTLTTSISRFAGRGLLQVRKFSPEILTVVGVAGIVTSVVLASKATLKLEETTQRAEDRIDIAKDHNPGDNGALAKAYAKNVLDYGKLYGPSGTLLLASIGCVLGANQILRKRNVALLAAYKTVESAFSEYRKRVVEELGEDKEREIRLGMRAIDTTDGEGRKIKGYGMSDEALKFSPYARFFEEGNLNWERAGFDYNIVWLKSVQSMFQTQLRANGHVFLNDVYKHLGFPPVKEGQVVGWVYGGEGDNEIDFGIFSEHNSNPVFYEGFDRIERTILLDFNVDGPILDLI